MSEGVPVSATDELRERLSAMIWDTESENELIDKIVALVAEARREGNCSPPLNWHPVL